MKGGKDISHFRQMPHGPQRPLAFQTSKHAFRLFWELWEEELNRGVDLKREMEDGRVREMEFSTYSSRTETLPRLVPPN